MLEVGRPVEISRYGSTEIFPDDEEDAKTVITSPDIDTLNAPVAVPPFTKSFELAELKLLGEPLRRWKALAALVPSK